MISAPYPPQIVRLWFQGNGSHVTRMVRPCLLGVTHANRLHGFLSLGFFPVPPGVAAQGDRSCPAGPWPLLPSGACLLFGPPPYTSALCGHTGNRRSARPQGSSGGRGLSTDGRAASP